MIKNIRNSTLVSELTSAFQKLYGNRLDKIFLYGSYARGTQTEESDVDFFVTLRDKNVSPYLEIDYYFDEVSHLSDKYHVDVSVKAASENFLQNQNNFLAKFISNEGVLIYKNEAGF